MPFTLSHPAAVLPLQRYCGGHVDFVALIIGSMTPDLSYYLPHGQFAGFAHTIAGSFLVCLPSGLVLLAVFYTVRSPVCFILPQPHRDALLRLCATRPSIGIRALVLNAACLIVGAWTHIFWDSFTHRTGWFVFHFSWLSSDTVISNSIVLPRYYILQQISSLAGGVVLAVAYFGWLRRQPVHAARPDRERWRYLLWATIFFLSSCIALPLAIYAAGPYRGYMAVRVLMFNLGVYAVSVGFCFVIVAAIVIHRLACTGRDS